MKSTEEHLYEIDRRAFGQTPGFPTPMLLNRAAAGEAAMGILSFAVQTNN